MLGKLTASLDRCLGKYCKTEGYSPSKTMISTNSLVERGTKERVFLKDKLKEK